MSFPELGCVPLLCGFVFHSMLDVHSLIVFQSWFVFLCMWVRSNLRDARVAALLVVVLRFLMLGL